MLSSRLSEYDFLCALLYQITSKQVLVISVEMDVRLVVWSNSYIDGAYESGHESMPVWLPGFAIKW